MSARKERKRDFRMSRLPGLAVLLLLTAGAFGWSAGTEATSSASGSSVNAVSSASRASPVDAASSASRVPGNPRALSSVVYDMAQGPLLRLCLVVAALGLLYRAWQFRKLTRALHKTPIPSPALRQAARAPRVHAARRRAAPHPVMRTVSLSFHVLLFLVPLLLPAHNALLHHSLRVSLPGIPSPVADWLTMIVVALGAFFLARRIFAPRIRLLSTLYDYAILLLALGPFVTGLMVHHHLSSSPWLMISHVASADLLLAAVPFTKLGHMPFLLFSRFFVSGDYAWRAGRRAWGGGA